MAIFNRQTAEQITQKMIDWVRGTTSQLTDFRVGSKNRAIFEAVAIVTEDLYDKMFKAIKKSIQQNLYTAFGFSALPAVNASGSARLYAQNPPSSDQPFYIPMGTQVQAAPTSSRGPVLFQTTQDVYMYYNSAKETGAVTINGKSVNGWTYVDVPIVCLVSGTVGNVESNTIQTLVGAPSGIGAVTNPAKFTTGQEAETLAEQKARFQLFISSRTRGTLESIEYGATTASVMDSTGTFVTERVASAKAVDGDGTFTIYVWNGFGAASPSLITAVKKVIDGYTDEGGNRVWGYKSAGIPYDAFSVGIVNVPLAMTVTPKDLYGVTDSDVTAGLIDLRPYITNAVSNYFASLKPGQTVVWSAIESVVKQIQGVYDVKLTAPSDNVTAGETQMLIPQLPITFTKGTTV
jgi:uncharacterized phage protein gp47/JayE